MKSGTPVISSDSDQATFFLEGPTKSLVVGASGMVGTQMLNCLGDGRVLATSRVERQGWVRLDLAELADESQAEELFKAHHLDSIYCVGGMTYVDGCEATPELAWRINARGPGVLARYAHDRGLPFTYYSTEYVFDGSENNPGSYEETSRPHPLSVYGKTKLEGEQRVLAAHPQALVVRTTVVYGPDPGQKNFLYSLIRNLSAGTAMKVPEDQISTPTYNRDLIRATFSLVEEGASGVFHVCGPERMGRLEFARRVAGRLGLDSSLLEGVPTADLRQPAPRPLRGGLAIQKLLLLHPTLRMRTVAESLDDCAAEIKVSHATQ
jgi:dTDP-4-dehydrorhamnose reductase